MEGLGLRDSGWGSQVLRGEGRGLWLRAAVGSWCRVWGLGFREKGLGFQGSKAFTGCGGVDLAKPLNPKPKHRRPRVPNPLKPSSKSANPKPPKPQTPNLQPQTPNRKPQNPNPKSQALTLNPEP